MFEAPHAPFFVVGCGRSGSTMLREMFNKHSQVYIPGESYFIHMLYWDWHPGMGDAELESFFQKLVVIPPPPERAVIDDMGWEHDELKAFLYESRDKEFSDVVRGIYELGMRRAGKVMWGDKTPRYVLYLPLLIKLFPQARIIHLVRDGRDVALSYLGFDSGPTTVRDAARYWRYMAGVGRHFHKERPDVPYIEVRYEDLVLEPEAGIKEICRFLDIQYEPAMVDFQAGHKRPTEKDSFGHELVGRPVTAGRVGRWRKEMTERDVVVFEALAGRRLQDFGYATATRPTTHWPLAVSTKLWDGIREAGLGVTRLGQRFRQRLTRASRTGRS